MIADTATDFAESVVCLLTDDALYAKIQTQAQAIALENYTWPKHLEKLIALYHGHFDHHE